VAKSITLLSLLVLALTLACSGQKQSAMRVSGLTCEYLSAPLGLGEAQPRLGWVLDSPRRGEVQSAYRVLVASSPELLAKDQGDLWDSGKILGNRTSQVAYGGTPLTSGQQCFWKVCAWDRDGAQTPFSEMSSWSTGLLDQSDWSGKWIGQTSQAPDTAAEIRTPGPKPVWLRAEFNVEKPVKRAVVYATARGVFDLHLNGSRVSDDMFAPEWTDFNKRIQYRTWDVTARVVQGANALGAVLADGWYSGFLAWQPWRGSYGYQNSFLTQLVIEFQDGSKQVVVSDDSWRVNNGPLLEADFQMGEVYDARLELSGWDSPAYDDAAWKPADVFEAPGVPLVALDVQPVRVTQEIKPRAIFQPKPGVYVLDMGTNFAGVVRLKVNGKAGDKVVLRYAERLNPDSTVYTENLRRARATDTYILKGGGEEIWEPRFTFHGFQYVELTGYPGEPSMDAVTGLVINSDTPVAGSFECSSPMINQLMSNVVRSQRANFISVPTDCPQRDERLGWMGDAQIFIRTATTNMDVAAFFTKWMQDVEDAQAPDGCYSEISPRYGRMQGHGGAAGWSDAGIVIPWTVHLVYGDNRIIERHWDSMVRWMDYVLRDNPDFVRRNGRGSDYGDWLSIGADTPKEILATAYWAYDAHLMSKMAQAVGREEEAKKYEELFESVRAAFQKEYVSADGHVAGETQTGYLLALYFDLLPDSLRPKAAALLVENIKAKDWHLSSGFLGVRQINPVLTMMGYPDVAWRLLETETFPSWFYPIVNGATSIWERWDGWTKEKGFQDVGMNSFNHYSLGSVGEWLYASVAGIDLDPSEPGFGRLLLRPRPGGSVTWVKAEYKSIHGPVVSDWKVEGDTLSLEVSLPANTSGRLYLPCPEGAAVTESGKDAAASEGVKALPREGDCAVFDLGAGSYSFKCPALKP